MQQQATLMNLNALKVNDMSEPATNCVDHLVHAEDSVSGVWEDAAVAVLYRLKLLENRTVVRYTYYVVKKRSTSLSRNTMLYILVQPSTWY